MIAYKGFNQYLQCTKGRGTFQYEEGKTYKEEKSKTADTGFHCAEYPLDCTKWYSIGSGVFYQVEAAGSIDEENSDSKIACTEMRLIKKLSLKELAGYSMMYIVQHPKRVWEMTGTLLDVGKDKASVNGEGIAIARGKSPRAKGKKGAMLGLIYEPDGIEGARLLEVDGKQIKPDTWYTTDGIEVWEVNDEAEAD